MRLIGIVGLKDGGKTTLVERLVRHLADRGLSVSTLKRSHHALDLDTPGTDSHRHRLAGARQVLLASDSRLALMEETARAEPLDALVARLAPCDIVIAEGWKHGTHRRIEVWRAACAAPPLCLADPSVAALATDTPRALDRPVFALDDIAAIARFVCST